MVSPASGWNENVIDACTATSRRSASDPGTLATSNGAAGPIALVSTVPEIVPGNSRSWIPSQCTHRCSRSPSTRAASVLGSASVSLAYARTNAAATARAPAAFVASSGVTWSGAAGPVGPDDGVLHATATTMTNDNAAIGRRRIEEPSLRSGSARFVLRQRRYARERRSRPGGRGRSSDRSRKVRTPKGRVLGRPRRGRPRGSATERDRRRAIRRAR